MLAETIAFHGVVPHNGAITPNCRLSLNTVWLVMHNPNLRHLREIAYRSSGVARMSKLRGHSMGTLSMCVTRIC